MSAEHEKQQLAEVRQFEKKPETYLAKIQCANCGKTYDVMIPKGTIVQNAPGVCTNCGCTNQQIEKYYHERQMGGLVPVAKI